MDPVWLNIFSVLFVFAMAIISPGPNFILVVDTALNRSRTEGNYTALGVAFGTLIFAVTGLLGFILLLDSTPLFSLMVRIIGSSYLVYLGVCMLIRRSVMAPINGSEPAAAEIKICPFNSILRGLFTNMTNPKAWAFYFSLFTLVGSPDFPYWAKLFLCFCIFTMALTWYGVIVLVVSERRIQQQFLRLQSWVNRVLGSVLIILGGKLWLAR